MAEFKILEKNGVNYVEIEMNSETVTTEAGAMRYYQGDLEMESKVGSVGGFLKAKISGESGHKPKWTGTGKLVLEPSLLNYYKLELNNESFVLDRGAFWAASDGVEVDIKINKAVSGIFSGEGLIQVLVRGTGTVIYSAPGPIEIIELNNEKLVVDGTFAVVRSESLNFSVQKSSKSILGSITSGEGLVNVFEGSGIVHIAPIPNQNIILQEVISKALFSSMSRK